MEGKQGKTRKKPREGHNREEAAAGGVGILVHDAREAVKTLVEPIVLRFKHFVDLWLPTKHGGNLLSRRRRSFKDLGPSDTKGKNLENGASVS